MLQFEMIISILLAVIGVIGSYTLLIRQYNEERRAKDSWQRVINKRSMQD